MEPDSTTPRIVTHLADEAATIEVGRELARDLVASSVIALVGDLGAGKTSFSKGLVAGLDYGGDVSSPTFTLLHEYVGGRLPVFHFDFYRLESVEELLDIGWDEYLSARGVIIAEWADKFPDAFPPEATWIALRHCAASETTAGRNLQVLERSPGTLE